MKPCEIILPAAWRPLAGNRYSVPVTGDTVGAMLANLAAAYPELRTRIYEGAAVHPAVLVFLGETDFRGLQGVATPLAPGQRVRILIAISGG